MVVHGMQIRARMQLKMDIYIFYNGLEKTDAHKTVYHTCGPPLVLQFIEECVYVLLGNDVRAELEDLL